MAHYGNFAARIVDHSNHQLFEGLFDFIIYAKKTFQGYLKFHRPIVSSVITFNQKDDPKKEGWKYIAFFHYMAAFLMRLMLLPLTAALYTLSRTGLIVLNPFTAWRNNPRKAFYMGLAWAVPTFLAFNNHVHNMIPGLRFSTPFTIDNFHRLSSAFGFSDGALGLGASGLGGLILGTCLSFGMACVLYLAKKAAQKGNAVELKDPRQTNLYDPANKKVNKGSVTYSAASLRGQPDTVLITAPKHRPIALFSGDRNAPLFSNDYNDLNSASDNLRYAYYQQKANKPIMWNAAPKRVKNLLTAFEDAYAMHGKPGFDMKADALKSAYEDAFERNGDKPDTISAKDCTHYRMDSTLANYTVDKTNHIFKKKAAQ